MGPRTVTMTEAKTNFSRLSTMVNETGTPITVLRRSRPWVEISPVAPGEARLALPDETREALGQARDIAQDPDRERFRTLDDLYRDLGI